MHATAVAVGARCVMIYGPSGAGKSDLALRCLLHPRSDILPEPVRLLGDDRLWLRREGKFLLARGHSELRGKLEVRGLGVLAVPVPPDEETHVALVVALTESTEIVRMPDADTTTRILGVDVPLLRLAPHEASAASKVLLALRYGLPCTE